jgi:hypothetical protein
MPGMKLPPGVPKGMMKIRRKWYLNNFYSLLYIKNSIFYYNKHFIIYENTINKLYI